jgi:hypothetical protein
LRGVGRCAPLPFLPPEVWWRPSAAGTSTLRPCRGQGPASDPSLAISRRFGQEQGVFRRKRPHSRYRSCRSLRSPPPNRYPRSRNRLASFRWLKGTGRCAPLPLLFLQDWRV